MHSVNIKMQRHMFENDEEVSMEEVSGKRIKILQNDEEETSTAATSTIKNVLKFDEDFFQLSSTKTKPTAKIYVGPWKYIEDFQVLYEQIYGDQRCLESYRLALSTLVIWKARRSYLCPAPVLATHVLLDVLVKDLTGNLAANSKRYDYDELQALYAHAIVRFYNFMSSTMQQYKMRTMYQTAKLLQINSVVVDIRHLCSHGQVLPDVSMLRYVAKYCLRWLKAHYWASMIHEMSNVTSKSLQPPAINQLDAKVALLLQLYDVALLCLLKGASSLNSAHKYLKGKRYTLLKEYFAQRDCGKLSQLLHFIVMDLAQLLKHARNICVDNLENIATVYVEGLVQLQHFYNLPAQNLKNNAKAVIFDATQSLFRMLSVYGLLEQYFYSLINICESNTRYEEAKRAGAAFWACELTKAFQAFALWQRQVAHENPLTKDFLFSKTNFNKAPKGVRSLLEAAGYNTRYLILIGYADKKHWDMQVLQSYVKQRLLKLNNYTAPIVESLLSLTYPALNEQKKQHLTQLIKLYEQQLSKSEVQQIHTVDELKQIYHKQQLNANGIIKTTDLNESFQNIWLLAEENEVVDWSITPLGKTPWELT